VRVASTLRELRHKGWEGARRSHRFAGTTLISPPVSPYPRSKQLQYGLCKKESEGGGGLLAHLLGPKVSLRIA